MSVKLITFDAAGTLVRVNWSPALLARECIVRLNLPLDPDSASERFSQMLRQRWASYMEINLLRSMEAGDEFWRQLCREWLTDQAQPPELIDALGETVWDTLYGPTQTFFSLYEDVLPILDHLKQTEVRLAIISNWDYSLPRILKMLGVYDRFEYVIASLEEGFEKPDPRIFHLALDRFNVHPSEAIHVGDDPTDDHSGAQGVGMRSLLIDRARKDAKMPYIASLAQITETAAWTS